MAQKKKPPLSHGGAQPLLRTKFVKKIRKKYK